MQQIKAVNEFVIRFANVNGTGSASANNLFAKSIFHMGIPVSPRNVFPSNIQGMPTWYEVRVSEKGYLGRRGDKADIIIGMNIQTLAQDIENVGTGGYFIYDCTSPLDEQLIRTDILMLGIPISEICLREYEDPRQRQLFKNIIYIGAIAALLDLDFDILKKLVSNQFKGNEKLIIPNIYALELGYQYAATHFSCPLPLKVKRADLVADSIIIDGNTAAGLGSVYGGASVCGWYPITPSTSVVEQFGKYCKRLRIDPATGKNNYALIQAEDELAAIGIVIGAAWNGARTFTATSGPGISLMSEFLGLAYFAEIPLVLINVQRAGPSTGMPTRTQQSDILACAHASHGDTKHILLFPATPTECFEQTIAAFDLAERVQTPVIVMSDLELGMNEHMCAPLKWDNDSRYDRGKILSAEQLDEVENFGRYLDVDDDGICYRTLPGTHPTKGAFFTRGTSRDPFAIYSEEGDVYVDNMERLNKKFTTAKSLVLPAEINKTVPPLAIGLVYYGTTAAAIDETIEFLAKQGVRVDTMRLRAFPFGQEVEDFVEQHQQLFVIEQNRDGQMRTLLIKELNLDSHKMIEVLHYDGLPITASFISCAIQKSLISDNNIAAKSQVGSR